MPGSAVEHLLYYINEDDFAGTDGGVDGVVDYPDWDDGIPFLCVEPDISGMKRGVIPNLNYKTRVLETRPRVHALANGTNGFSVYLHGRSEPVAAAARATIIAPAFPIADFLRNAWGGLRLGYRTTYASGTTTAPVITAAAGAQYQPADWIFAVDVSADATRGYLRKIASIATDTFTMWPGHAIPFTPAVPDIFGAVISAYPHRSVLVNRQHADHVTQAFLHSGEIADDVQEAIGVKLNLASIEGIAAGEAGMLKFEGLAARVRKEGLTAPAPSDPLGDAPLATSTGTDTLVWVSAVGSPLALAEPQSVTVTPGIMSQAVPAVGGVEGRVGYTLAADSADAPMIEMVFDYDDVWSQGFVDDTRYQVLIQVGTIPGEAYGIFAAESIIDEDPERTAATDLSVMTVKFRCLESTISTVATGDAFERVRAKLELLFTCALS
jgi:hypothetical protein